MHHSTPRQRLVAFRSTNSAQQTLGREGRARGSASYTGVGARASCRDEVEHIAARQNLARVARREEGGAHIYVYRDRPLRESPRHVEVERGLTPDGQ
ncbi:hypothetical protein FRC12_014458, partial [Ceratobasidium sp. 428]